MKSTNARKQAAAQKADLKARARALTMKTNAGERKSGRKRQGKRQGVSLEPGADADVGEQGAQPPARGRELRAAAKRKSNSLANLKVGRPGERPKGPTLTKDADADIYVRLRSAGVPPLEAVVYFAKGDERLSAPQWQTLATSWETAALTKAAWDRFHGGEWQTLDEDQRTDAALRLHLAQCAYLLYTSDINQVDTAMGKVRYAKDTILAKIAIDRAGGTDDKFTQFLATLTANASAGAPAIWKGGEREQRQEGADSDRGRTDSIQPARRVRRDHDAPAGADFTEDAGARTRQHTRH